MFFYNFFFFQMTSTGEIIDEFDEAQSTKYKLVGVLVHSGQASGGHYYSYILHRYVVQELYPLTDYGFTD